jgi:hypothetical protein
MLLAEIPVADEVRLIPESSVLVGIDSFGFIGLMSDSLRCVLDGTYGVAQSISCHTTGPKKNG